MSHLIILSVCLSLISPQDVVCQSSRAGLNDPNDPLAELPEGLDKTQTALTGTCNRLVCLQFCNALFLYPEKTGVQVIINEFVGESSDDFAGEWFAFDMYACECSVGHVQLWGKIPIINRYHLISRYIEMFKRHGDSGLSRANYDKVLPICECDQDKCHTFCNERYSAAQKRMGCKDPTSGEKKAGVCAKPAICGGMCLKFPNGWPKISDWDRNDRWGRGRKDLTPLKDVNHPDTPGPGDILDQIMGCWCMHQERGTAVVAETLTAP